MKHILNPKIQFLIRVFVFLYLSYSFFEWSLNPGHWHWFNRLCLVLLFIAAADAELSTKK